MSTSSQFSFSRIVLPLCVSFAYMPSRVVGGDSVTEALIEYHLLPGCLYSSVISLTGCFLNRVLFETTESPPMIRGLCLKSAAWIEEHKELSSQTGSLIKLFLLDAPCLYLLQWKPRQWVPSVGEDEDAMVVFVFFLEGCYRKKATQDAAV